MLLLLTTTLDGSGNGIVLGGSAGTVEVVMKTAKTASLNLPNPDRLDEERDAVLRRKSDHRHETRTADGR